MKQPSPSTRVHLPELEVIRTLSFVAVVLQHIIGAYLRRPGVGPGQNIVLGLLFGACKFAVPAFVFVSGVVLFLHYYGRLDYGRFLKKRLKTILIPYVIWSFVYVAYAWIRFGAPPFGMMEYVKRLLTGTISFHTWYVLLLVQMYLLLPLAFRLFGALSQGVHSGRQAAVHIAGVVVAYLLLLRYAWVFAPIPVVGRLMFDLRASNFLYYLVYFFLGGLCALYADQFRAVVRASTVWLAVGALVLYGFLELTLFQQSPAGGVVNVNLMGSMTGPMFLFTLACILLVYRLGLWLPTRGALAFVPGWASIPIRPICTMFWC